MEGSHAPEQNEQLKELNRRTQRPVASYIRDSSKMKDQPTAARLGFFFRHLDSADATVAADAFAEFAKATDAEVLSSKAQLKPSVLRKFILDPKTPVERLGVYAICSASATTATRPRFWRRRSATR